MEKNHKEKAEQLLNNIAKFVREKKAAPDVSLASATEAQAHATLALVEAIEDLQDQLGQ